MVGPDESRSQKENHVSSKKKVGIGIAVLVAVIAIIILAITLLMPPAESTGSNNSSSSETTQSQSADQQKIEAAVLISSDNADGSVSLDTEVSLDERATAYDALEATGLSIQASSSQYGMYVEGIDGLATGDHGDASGWTYSVNGVPAEVACDAYELEDGDSVEWTYVTEWE